MANRVVVKQRRGKINIGMLIFGIIFIYVFYCVVMYFQTNHIVRYEVKEGTLADDNVYRGIILRNESLVYAEYNGHLYYYVQEEERVGKNNLVYIVDETGKLQDRLNDQAMGENSLSKKELALFRSEIVDYMHGFDGRYFDDVYDFKHSLTNTVLKIANENMLDSIDVLNEASGSGGAVQYCRAQNTGVVTYWTDGYEGLTPEQITAEHFNEKEYKKELLLGNRLVAAGDVAYKICGDEKWSVVIPVTAERGAELLQEEYIKVRFLKNQYESWAEVSLLQNSDGNTYLELAFNNSMITFLNERYIDLELLVENETGLKIPNSAIVEKEFFLIEEDYIITDSDVGDYCIMRQTFAEDGTITNELVEVEVYNYDENSKEYYLDASFLEVGDVLYTMDRQGTFTVSKHATLIGVYNVNKGYADFKQITILSQNDEYAIVKTNTRYGLAAYDFIVLNADSVVDDQFMTN